MWPFGSSRKPVRAPIAVITGPTRVEIGVRIGLSASASTGDIINWRWGLEGPVTAWGQQYISYAFTTLGMHVISLVVIGPTGLVAETNQIVHVLPESQP